MLRYLLWLPFIVIALMLLLALLFPKATIETSYAINAPVTVTWDYFNNNKKMHLWMKGFKRTQVIKETPNKIGSKYVLYFMQDGNEMQMNQTITEFEMHKKFGFIVEHPGANSHNKIEFVENNGNTIIKQKIEMQPTSFFFRPVLLIVKIAMKKQNRHSYNKLKQLIESEYRP